MAKVETLDNLLGTWARLDPPPPFHEPDTLDLVGAAVAYDCSILWVVYGHTERGNPVSVTLHCFHVTHPDRPTAWVVEVWATAPARTPTLPAIWSLADTAALAIARAVVGVREVTEARARPQAEAGAALLH